MKFKLCFTGPKLSEDDRPRLGALESVAGVRRASSAALAGGAAAALSIREAIEDITHVPSRLYNVQNRPGEPELCPPADGLPLWAAQIDWIFR